jgi:signal transduction histidine kinase
MDEMEQLRRRVVELELELADLQEVLLDRTHQIRTHAVPIRGFLKALLEDKEGGLYSREDRAEFFHVMIESVDRITQLLEDPVEHDAERRWPIIFEMNWQHDVDLSEVVRNVFASTKRKADQHSLVLDFRPEHILLEADADKLDLLIRPIVTNAIEYSPDGGDIVVSAHIEPQSIGYPGGSVLVQFKSRSAGIVREDLCRIAGVDPAFTIRPRRKTPLMACAGFSDLDLTQRLIEVCGGHLWFVNTSEEKGLTCNLRLPLRQT